MEQQRQKGSLSKDWRLKQDSRYFRVGQSLYMTKGALNRYSKQRPLVLSQVSRFT
jgi:hypothetical protein